MSNPDNQQICPICNLKKDYKLVDVNMFQDLIVSDHNKVKVCIECWLKDAHATAKNKATENDFGMVDVFFPVTPSLLRTRIM